MVRRSTGVRATFSDTRLLYWLLNGHADEVAACPLLMDERT